jgi:hypothetical protein
MSQTIVPPRSLFATKVFSALAASLLTASAPTIIDMQKNGVSLDKLMFLGISVLTSVGVLADKLEKDESVFTPTGIPGRDKNVAEAIFDTKVTAEVNKVVAAVVPDVAGVAQPIVEKVIANEVVKAVAPLATRTNQVLRSLIK